MLHIRKLRRFYAVEELGPQRFELAELILMDDHEENVVEAVLLCTWNKRAKKGRDSTWLVWLILALNILLENVQRVL